MFCTNCGKQIIDTARFCNFCGMAIAQKTENVPSVTQPTAPASIPTEQSVAVSENQPVSSVSIEQTTQTEQTAQTEQTDQAEQSVQPQQAESISASVPQAVDLPKEGASPVISAVSPSAPSAPLTAPAQPVQSAQPTTSAQFVQPQATAPNAVPQSANTAAAVNNQPSPKTEREPRMYTAGHIIMCLASTAVMAIVAGIFAGLYFSVV